MKGSFGYLIVMKEVKVQAPARMQKAQVPHFKLFKPSQSDLWLISKSSRGFAYSAKTLPAMTEAGDDVLSLEIGDDRRSLPRSQPKGIAAGNPSTHYF